MLSESGLSDTVELRLEGARLVIEPVKAPSAIRRGDVYSVNLDPTIGTEINKTRPGLTRSPDDMNAVLPPVIIAPIISKGHALGCRPERPFDGGRSSCWTRYARSISAD